MDLRLKKVYTKLKEENLDGLLISSSHNISYLTRHTSRDCLFLISKKGNVYFTDFRYREEMKRALKGRSRLKQTNGSQFKAIAKTCREMKLKRIGFEEKTVSLASYKKLKEELGGSVMLVPSSGIVERYREIKDGDELENIRKAVHINILALRFIRKFIAPGRREIEVAAELERFIRYHGASSSAFETIVASGPNSSYPHHRTSMRRIKNNEHVLIDIGVDFCGYKSDLTRVFFLGKINPLVRRVYDIVKEAQLEAIKSIKPSVSIDKIDRLARQYINKKGYGGFFGHSLGHGIGLEVHETPRISDKEKDKLKAGMVFTVEPGIYLAAKFGIRLEDMVLVTRKGFEVLSGAIDK